MPARDERGATHVRIDTNFDDRPSCQDSLEGVWGPGNARQRHGALTMVM